MRILISNDDGCQSPGIRHLTEALTDHNDVVVVAPDRDRSGASNSLTLDHPIRYQHLDPRTICVSGTPTDCVHIALTGLLETLPDMVVSGINHGANLGDDVIYSGTVAAAMEGRFLGLPAVAISLAGSPPQHFPTAERTIRWLIDRLRERPIAQDSILNVNVPDRPWADVRGIRITRLGHRHKAEPAIRDTDPRGRSFFWIGPPGLEQDAGPGTDFQAIQDGAISITPLQVDLTRHRAIDDLTDWLGDGA
jgi:5'-nucleotidase